MNSIGGFLELELHDYGYLQDNSFNFNTARNALRFLLRNLDVKEIFVPFYTCPVVWEAVVSENVSIIPYDVDDRFEPLINFSKDSFVIYTNYFGVCENIIKNLSSSCSNLIVDNAQAFWSKQAGLASFYSPRKFFGVPDGGVLLLRNGLSFLNSDYPVSESYDSCLHLLKRADVGASTSYSLFLENEQKLNNMPIQQMSCLTSKMLKAINYSEIASKRVSNFELLHSALKSNNELKNFCYDYEVPMYYPYKTSNKNLREILIKNKIFVAKYWSPCEQNACMTSCLSQQMAESIIPLPIDQRYGNVQMNKIIEVIKDNGY